MGTVQYDRANNQDPRNQGLLCTVQCVRLIFSKLFLNAACATCAENKSTNKKEGNGSWKNFNAGRRKLFPSFRAILYRTTLYSRHYNGYVNSS